MDVRLYPAAHPNEGVSSHPSEERAVKASVQQKTSVKAQVGPEPLIQKAVVPGLMPTIKLAKPKLKPNVETYAQTIERLSQRVDGKLSVLEEAAVAVQEMLKVTEEQKLSPADVTVVLSLNISATQEIICVACGRPWHDYQPTLYRTKNPEFDLLSDTVVAFQEKMSEAGFRYGFLVYDDLDALVLREPDLPSTPQDRADTLRRYYSFRDRVSYPDAFSRDWQSKMSAKYESSFATKPQIGQPQDARMFDLAFKTFEGRTTAVNSLVVATSTAPTVGTGSVAARAKSNRISMCALAVGKKAEEVASRFAFPSVIVHDAHELLDNMTTWVHAVADEIRDTHVSANAE